jgi:general secretion pathway protein J
MSRRSGFTLIELLVALAIFALLAAFAYRGLTTLLESRRSLGEESRKWRDFVGRVERDLQAALERPSKGPGGTPQPALSSVIDLGAAPEPGLALTRSGTGLNTNALAGPQRIAYRFTDGRIERLAWPAMDAAPRPTPPAMPVLAGARSLAFRFLDPAGAWRPTWGLPGSAETMPLAVEFTLELASGERIVRLVDLPRGLK